MKFSIHLNRRVLVMQVCFDYRELLASSFLMTLLRIVLLYGFTSVEPGTVPPQICIVAQLSMNLDMFGCILFEFSCIV